jgi:hypothetical protein
MSGYKHNYKNSSRVGDVNVEKLSKDEIIELLYHRLWETDNALKRVKNIVGSSHGTKDINDYNMEILNPLWSTFG